MRVWAHTNNSTGFLPTKGPETLSIRDVRGVMETEADNQEAVLAALCVRLEKAIEVPCMFARALTHRRVCCGAGFECTRVAKDARVSGV